MPRCFIVIPVHNRRAITLRCLRALAAEGVLAWATPIVVDDGSSDGTGEAVRAEFPAAIVLRGEGDLWWTGGIVAGMREAVARDAEFVFWLNDDTTPAPGALALLLDETQTGGGIAGGTGYLPGETAPAYGGYRRGFWKLREGLQPGEATLPCDALNGNMVCLPRAVIERIGFPDAAGLPHGYGDFDYTLRASAAGIPVRLVGRARGAAHANLTSNYRSWLLSDVPLGEIWRGLGRRGAFIYQPAMQRFYWRHWGVRGAVYCAWILLKLAAITAIRPLVPRAWLVRLRGARSKAWQHEQRHAGSTTNENE
jgi:GT2 family glycosyltransferase